VLWFVVTFTSNESPYYNLPVVVCCRIHVVTVVEWAGSSGLGYGGGAGGPGAGGVCRTREGVLATFVYTGPFIRYPAAQAS
jgi:hypothetical protein